MRIYRVVVKAKQEEQQLLVKASTPSGALRVATEQLCEVTKATQDDLVRLTKAGVEVIEGMPDGSAPEIEEE